MIAGIPSYHDYVRDKGGPMGRCGACGFHGPMANGDTGYLCPACHSMALELELVDGTVYQQFRPVSRNVAVSLITSRKNYDANDTATRATQG